MLGYSIDVHRRLYKDVRKSSVRVPFIVSFSLVGAVIAVIGGWIENPINVFLVLRSNKSY